MMLFSSKIDTLVDSVTTAAQAAERSWGRAMLAGMDRTVTAVGSGGSAITANFFASCRRTLGYPSTSVLTPLEFVLASAAEVDGPIWFFSGSGDNADILAAFDHALNTEARELVVITSRSHGALARKAASLNVPVVVAPTATPKDGFLATHSLLAQITALLLAAEMTIHGSVVGLHAAARFATAVHAVVTNDMRERFTNAFAELTADMVVLVLHDPRLAAAAVALETSIWEAALCSVQRADFRNFAHGRHVLPGTHPSRVFVLALTGFETRSMWEEIDLRLTSSVRRFSLDFADCGRHQCATSIATSLALIEACGKAVGIDPANPGVDEGGRALFQSQSLRAIAEQWHAPVRTKAAAVRKFDHEEASFDSVSACHAAYLSAVLQSEIGGIVLDYDGTVVATERRTDPVRSDLAALLNMRVSQGLKLGIATGRGSSVVANLRAAIDARHHPDVIVGYYNGALLRRLSDEPALEREQQSADIEAVHSWLIKSKGIPEAALRKSPVQLTLLRSDVSDVIEFIADLKAAGHHGVQVAMSGHSIDICLVATRKTNVIHALAAAWELSPDAILSAGDSGAPFGNDYDLLGRSLAVGVGEVCGRPKVGWPLYGPDVLGPDALVRLLQDMQPLGGNRFKVQSA